MDTLSHGLLALLLCKEINNRTKKKLSVGKAFLFGIFPDFFSFTLLFIWGMITLGVAHPPHDISRTEPIIILTNFLYSLSHSIIIFAIIFMLILIITKKYYFEMLGWLLHILADVPTHSTSFYPTPLLYPINGFAFNGIPWFSFWFVLINYLILGILGIYVYRHELSKYYQ